MADDSAPTEAAAEWVPIDRLKPWADNPRMNDRAVAHVAKSIKRFGFGAPVIARKADGEIIAGHTRILAAKQLGLKKVPVRFLDLDPVDAHLLAVADNKMNELAGWNDDQLAAFMREVPRAELPDLGFSDAEIKALLGEFDDKPLEDDGGDIVDEGLERITFRVLMVQAGKAKEVVTKALADAEIEVEW